MRKMISIFIILISAWMTDYTSAQYYVEQNSGVTSELTSVSLNQNNNACAWICGIMGVVLRTTNFGTNWVSKSGNGLPLTIDLYNIFCIDSAIALTAGVSGNGTYVYRTSNGGNNWQQVLSQATGFIDAIWMKTPLVGFIVGDPVGGRWSLWRTSNGGLNWDSSGMNLPAPGTEAGWNNSIFVKNNNIWFGTNNHKIYRSTNFGTSWLAGTTAELSTTAIWFYNSDSLYGYYGGDSVHKTTNGGATWTTMTCPGTGSFAGFAYGLALINDGFSPPYINWTVRNDNKIYQNFNMSTWGPVYTASTGSYRNIGANYNNLLYTWAVRSNGGITRVTIVYGGVKNISTAPPNNFSLSQNYPNPFNPVTKIKFDIPPSKGARGMITQLIIYDILGREITTLVNEPLSPGTYEVQWDGTNYPSGVYFYKLVVSDASTPLSITYSETRKMVLIK